MSKTELLQALLITVECLKKELTGSDTEKVKIAQEANHELMEGFYEEYKDMMARQQFHAPGALLDISEFQSSPLYPVISLRPNPLGYISRSARKRMLIPPPGMTWKWLDGVGMVPFYGYCICNLRRVFSLTYKILLSHTPTIRMISKV